MNFLKCFRLSWDRTRQNRFFDVSILLCLGISRICRICTLTERLFYFLNRRMYLIVTDNFLAVMFRVNKYCGYIKCLVQMTSGYKTKTTAHANHALYYHFLYSCRVVFIDLFRKDTLWRFVTWCELCAWKSRL